MKTPCVNKCNPLGGQCYGCGRTERERANWFSYTEAQRNEIEKQLKQRLEKLKND